MNKIITGLMIVSMAFLGACKAEGNQDRRDRASVERQQQQYATAQPIPAYDWSLERHLLISLYNVRNAEVATHSVWRSDYGVVEGDCPSMGYGLPYDTSLTNPQSVVHGYQSLASVGQAEPNGVFASTNTAATWVFCLNELTGALQPVYVEAKVTVYPGPVDVDYNTNRVVRRGDATVNIDAK